MSASVNFGKNLTTTSGPIVNPKTPIPQDTKIITK